MVLRFGLGIYVDEPHIHHGNFFPKGFLAQLMLLELRAFMVHLRFMVIIGKWIELYLSTNRAISLIFVWITSKVSSSFMFVYSIVQLEALALYICPNQCRIHTEDYIHAWE